MGKDLRLLFAFCLIGLIVLVVAALSIMRLSHLNDEISVVANHRVPALEASAGILTSFLNYRLQNSNILSATSAEERIEYERILTQAKTQLSDQLNRMSELAKAEEAKALTDALIRDISRFFALQVEQMTLLDTAGLDEALLMQNQEMKMLREAVTNDVRSLVDFQKQRIRDSDDQTNQVYDQSLMFLGIILLMSIVLVFLLATLFTKSILRPTRVALSAAESIANGDLTQPIEDDGDDELAQLVAALVQMQSNLRHAIEEIKESSDMLASTSEELSIVTQQSNNGINEQNQQLEMSVSAVTELTAAIAEVARNAVGTSKESENANQKASTGKMQVQNTISEVQAVLKKYGCNRYWT
ncbi:methyl-accepting chemotaxis protein [Alteromonas pelagimontana]|uniref:Methyl-accepting chemotaxis protein n=1 Tax=Alteromonas pelagimontana TaxID=1858656 RepID=A0A6M4MBF7_9ALTE|nr:methyl-accepting chemotaxis protein [Alteromonas pelagimontana]QJR80138.1 methyl-accepting chemotaxis protein [Alteromonas pelagimontana]